MRKQGKEGKGDQKQQCLGSAAEKVVWGVPHTCSRAGQSPMGCCTQLWGPHPFLGEARGPGSLTRTLESFFLTLKDQDTEINGTE